MNLYYLSRALRQIIDARQGQGEGTNSKALGVVAQHVLSVALAVAIAVEVASNRSLEYADIRIIVTDMITYVVLLC